MVVTANQKAKRKNKSSDLKIEPAMKALKKDDIILQYNALLEKFQAMKDQNMLLQQEKTNHVEAILLLEETVKILENKSSHIEKKSITVQTEIIRCEECEFPADNMHDLVYHMYEFHPLQTQENGMACNFCSDKFKSNADLMMHKKRDHIERVQLCVNFDDGNCDFGDACWFSHETSSTKTCLVYSCNYCELKFKIKSKFMKHRKTMHSEYVNSCKNEIDGSCEHGSQNCWFNHEETKK